MNEVRRAKVKASHLARDAYLYVRQATRGQGLQDGNRLQTQYNLQQQAVALGWAAERVIVIDGDIGQSGASTAERLGFQKLVRQVRRGCVGVVMALDWSRLTRNFIDWHGLLEACATSDTLLLDQDQLYDPGDSRDRVVLECERMTPMRKTAAGRLQHEETLV